MLSFFLYISLFGAFLGQFLTVFGPFLGPPMTQSLPKDPIWTWIPRYIISEEHWAKKELVYELFSIFLFLFAFRICFFLACF